MGRVLTLRVLHINPDYGKLAGHNGCEDPPEGKSSQNLDFARIDLANTARKQAVLVTESGGADLRRWARTR